MYSQSRPIPGTLSRTEMQDGLGHTETVNEISRVNQEKMGKGGVLFRSSIHTGSEFSFYVLNEALHDRSANKVF